MDSLLVANTPTACDRPLAARDHAYDLEYGGAGGGRSCGLTAAAGDRTGDPRLGPLAANGGPTRSMALLAGSAAIDAGPPGGCKDAQGRPLQVDGRGWPRPWPAARCDIGAFEARPASPANPVDPPAPGLQGVHYFAQTGHTVSGVFYDFYRRYGDLTIFGLPLTEAFADHRRTVQYFERARLATTPAGVVEDPLGSLVTAGRTFPPVAPPRPGAGRLYVAATHHTLSGRFLDLWQRHHGRLLFGAPISEPLREANGDGTGRTYLVQYFQNARLEYHPEHAGTGNEVQIGLLGRQYLRKIGML